MPRLLAVVVLVVVGAASVAVASASQGRLETGFAFGRLGGSIRPFTIRIDTAGVIHATEAAPAHRVQLTRLQLANLNRTAFVVDFATLPTHTACAGALPDVAEQFIRVGARTVRVHGTCVARFNRLWKQLSRVALRR